MTKTIYVSIEDVNVNELQGNIMLFVDWWVHVKKCPIPQREIVIEMKNKGIKDFTTVNALNALLTKGYIRKAFTISNKTTYVQLRRV